MRINFDPSDHPTPIWECKYPMFNCHGLSTSVVFREVITFGDSLAQRSCVKPFLKALTKGCSTLGEGRGKVLSKCSMESPLTPGNCWVAIICAYRPVPIPLSFLCEKSSQKTLSPFLNVIIFSLFTSMLISSRILET